jgi:sugar-specific transcriptional regulator TrmB
MLINELEKIGLNEKETKIYLALLELGGASIQQLAAKSGVKRTTVYDILASLKEKGLINEITKNKKSVFSAEDPRKLENILEEKRDTLKRILPEILAIANLLDKKPKIKFYEGIEGIKNVYRDTLNYPDQELLAWVSEEAIAGFDLKFLDEYYLPKRLEKKIWVRAIASNKEHMRQYQGLDEKALRRTKLVSSEQFPMEVEINLYGKNKIGLMSFGEKIGLIIESQKIYATLKSIFEMNWQIADAKNKPSDETQKSENEI